MGRANRYEEMLWPNCGSYDQTVRLWDAASGQALQTLQGHTGWIWSVCFSPAGQALASSSVDGTIKLWDSDKF